MHILDSCAEIDALQDKYCHRLEDMMQNSTHDNVTRLKISAAWEFASCGVIGDSATRRKRSGKDDAMDWTESDSYHIEAEFVR